MSAGRRKDMDSDRVVRNGKLGPERHTDVRITRKAMLAALGDKLD